MPLVRMCPKTYTRVLVVRRNVPKHSPIFKMLDTVQEDYLGKYLGHSTEPNCTIRNSTVIAVCDMNPGTELTIQQPITKYLDSL